MEFQNEDKKRLKKKLDKKYKKGIVKKITGHSNVKDIDIETNCQKNLVKK